jgi:hypothetical protein
MTPLPRLRRTTLALAALTVALVACTASPGTAGPSGTAGSSGAGQSGRPVVTAIPSSSSSTGAGSTWPVDQARLDHVLDLAAAESGLGRTTLVIVSAEAVTWNDGSLGCPKPGVMYTQALVDGFRVVVAAGDRQLDYHMSQTGQPRLCQGPVPAGSSGG